MNPNGTRHENTSARAVLSSETLSTENSSSPTLLLASASPRRAQILQTLSVPFRVVKSTFEEPAPTPEHHVQPAQFVERLALEKARAAQIDEEETQSRVLILAADTIVWHNDEILGKPRDEEDAIAMLSRLRGQEHLVLTGVCLRRTNSGEIEYSTLHESTRVVFNDVSDEWIQAYVATGEPLDKAGSYGAQDKGALLVKRIEGDFWNVVGLPLAPLSKLLANANAPIECFWKK
jgi:septum formation protein